MLQRILFVLILTIAGSTLLFSQQGDFKPDTIGKLNGKKIAATVFRVDKYNVVYLDKTTKAEIKIPRKEVSHIVYRTGKVQNVEGNVQSTTATTKVAAAAPRTNTAASGASTPRPTPQSAASPAKIDSVYKRDGKILLVSIAQTTEKVVFYKIPGKPNVFSIDKKELVKIVYHDGKVEEFELPAPVLKDVNCDTIIHLSGKRILAQVIKVNVNDVTIQKPKEAEPSVIQRKEIEKIIYRGGRIEEFNKSVLQMLDDTQWEAVIITENASDVVGLYKRGTVVASSASDARDVKSAKKSATIRLQKKASALKANIVLITRQEAKGGYGEVPGYEMEGVAYGFEATGEETLDTK